MIYLIIFFLFFSKQSYKNQWIDINAIYNDYIRQRSHTRLNGTRWETLSDFAMYLGKNGICQVEQKAEEIWHIKYIEKDPELIKKQVESEKKQKREKDEEERLQEEIQRRIQKENSLMETPTHAPTELDLEKKHQIKFSLGGLKTSSNKDTNNTNNSSFEESENSKQITLTSDEKQTPKFIEQKSLPAPSLKRKLEIEENSISSSLNSEPTSKKSKTDPNVWLMEGIIVKILNQKLQNGKFYKKKGIVEKILDNSSVAFVKLLEEKVKLKIDQSQLETVIPQLGKPVMVVKGHHKGKLGILQELDQTKFTAKVKLEKEATLIEAEFDDICKIEEQ